MNSETRVPRQIPLQFGNYQPLDFDTFITSQYQELLSLLKTVATGEVTHHVYLWGNSGSGKSHLLQATCRAAGEAGRHVAYVPLAQIEDFSPDMLHDLGMLDLVCVDSLDYVADKQDWQQSLVWLYNELRDNGHAFLMAGKQAPQGLSLQVEDLRSRLSWDLVFQLKEPGDELKMQVLQQQASMRAFTLPDEVTRFLLQRVDRNLGNLIAVLDRIDEASLAEKRKITVPFVKTLIQ